MNLHIIHDEKFINGAIEQFEHSFPNKNKYLKQDNGKGFKCITENANIIELDFFSENIHLIIEEFLKKYNIKNIFIHYLDELKALIVLKILKIKQLKIYWIFFGADLYKLLSKYRNYDLYDYYEPSKLDSLKYDLKFFIKHRKCNDRLIINVIKKVDYFCFWNIYDYNLLISNFKTRAKFKYFMYYKSLNCFKLNDKCSTTKEINLLINHSSSYSGNHISIIKSIKNYEKELDKIIIPLSYGSESHKNEIIKVVENISWKEKFIVLFDFLVATEYYSLIKEVNVAFFGMKRQEAGANLLFLLNNGVKIFLRNENNLLNLFKDYGFIIFSLSDFENKITNLTPLTQKEKEHNSSLFAKLFNPNVFDSFMKNLINDN